MLGEELKKRREAVGMSVTDVAREAKISSRYIRALEAGEYGVFSARVYAQGVLRRVIKVCRIEDGDWFTTTCSREWEAVFAGGGTNPPLRAKNGAERQNKFFLTPRRLGIGAAAGFSILLLGFWSARLITFAAPPMLTIQSPADQSGFVDPTVDVTGVTEKESSLTVNGRELTIDERGNFHEKIELPQGVSILRFVSRNRFGKEQAVVRTIFVE